MNSSAPKIKDGWNLGHVFSLLGIAFIFWFIFFGPDMVGKHFFLSRSIKAARAIDPNLPDADYFDKLAAIYRDNTSRTLVCQKTANQRYALESVNTDDPGGFHESGDLGSIARERTEKGLCQLLRMLDKNLRRVETIRITYRAEDSSKAVATYAILFRSASELIGVDDGAEVARLAAKHTTVLEDTCSGRVMTRRTKSR